MAFPKLYKVCEGNELCLYFQYAIIEDGKIIVCNGNILVYSDLNVFAENVELAEGKVLDIQALKQLSQAKYNEFTCTESGINAYTKKSDCDHIAYFGEIVKDDFERNIIHSYENGESVSTNLRFPKWKTTIPSDADYENCKGYTSIHLSAKDLSMLNNCFVFENNNNGLRFQFPTKETHPVRVSLCCQLGWTEGEQRAIVMPLPQKS